MQTEITFVFWDTLGCFCRKIESVYLTTNEACVLEGLLFLLLLRPEVCKCVDDDTKDEVEDDDDDDEEEEHVVQHPEGKQGLVVGRGPEHVSDSTTVPEAC